MRPSVPGLCTEHLLSRSAHVACRALCLLKAESYSTLWWATFCRGAPPLMGLGLPTVWHVCVKLLQMLTFSRLTPPSAAPEACRVRSPESKQSPPKRMQL